MTSFLILVICMIYTLFCLFVLTTSGYLTIYTLPYKKASIKQYVLAYTVFLPGMLLYWFARFLTIAFAGVFKLMEPEDKYNGKDK